MGWSVGWDYTNYRWRGYSVPAFCDAKGCREVIDRGMGYVCEANEWDDYFVCGQHTYSDIDPDDLPPEHPEWLEYLQTNESWEKWRSENKALLTGWIEQTKQATA